MVLVLSILSDCQSISLGFRFTDLNSNVDARVIAFYKEA